MFVFPDFIYKAKECDEALRPFLASLCGPVCFLVEWDDGKSIKITFDPDHPTFFEFNAS